MGVNITSDSQPRYILPDVAMVPIKVGIHKLSQLGQGLDTRRAVAFNRAERLREVLGLREFDPHLEGARFPPL